MLSFSRHSRHQAGQLSNHWLLLAVHWHYSRHLENNHLEEEEHRATRARLVPREGPYRHAEGNSSAHIGSLLTGNSQWIPVADGRLALGTWQHVFFAEFDGPRTRTVLVQFLAGQGG